MLSLPPSVRIFVARQPTDMRKAFDGLSAMVTDLIKLDPLSGHLFVFINKRRNRMKVLWWDRGGYWLLYKRLECGTFDVDAWDFASEESIEVRASELMLVLDGIDVRGVRRRPRHDIERSSRKK
jgi:transposase